MNLIHDKLKQQVPADKQLQCSHFVRLVELLNELPRLQASDLQTLLQFQFPQHTYQMLCNALAFIIVKQGNEQIKQVIEILLQFIAKKQKGISLTLLITLIQLTYHEIQPFSYSITQDITIQLMRLLKGSDYKLVCNTFQFLIETQKQEILKHALKLASNNELMHAGLQGLIYLMEKDVISEQILILVSKCDESPIFFKFFSSYLFQQQAILQLAKKEKSKQLQPREQAQRIFQLFDENLSKFPTNINGNIFLAYKKYLTSEYKRLGLPIIRGSFEISCSYLNSMQLDDPCLHSVYKKSAELCIYMIQQVQLNERKELLDYFFDKITKAKNQKWNVYVYKILLKGMNFLFDTLGSQVFDDKRSKPSEFIDSLTPIFRINDLLLHPNSIDRPICVSISRNVFGLFESFFKENKKWQQSILSALLNYAKISLADLSVKESNNILNILKIQCALLSKLFQQLDLSIHSVSSELINHLWDSAKSFLNKSNAFKRIGWIVIAELLMVPYFGTANKVKEIGGLIEQTLNSKDEIKDELQLLSYCSVGLVIISILTCPSLSKTIKDTTKKFLAQQTIAMYQKLQQCKFDKTSPIMISCKYIFYQTIRQVTPKYYSNELNSLVQYSLDDIVNCNSKWFQVNIHKSNHHVDELFGMPRSEFQLIGAASKFLGHILSSTSFTLKNKINFIRYLSGTLQTQVVNLKDQCKSKQQCYLFCVYQIASKLNQSSATVSQEFNEQIFQIINLCQSDQTSELCAVLYCGMLQIKDVDQAEQLNLLLSQHSNTNYASLVIELIKKKLSGVQLQVQNLFMKVVSHMTNDVHKIISLFEQVDHHYLRNAWVFLVFALSQREKPVQIREFKKLTHIILHYVRNNGVKDIYLNILYQECRYRLQQKPFYILQLDLAMEQDTEETVQKTMQLLIKKPSTKIATFLDYLTDKYNSISFLKPILFVLNQLFTNQRVHSTTSQMELRNKMKNIFVKVYSMPINDLLQLLQPYILEEFIPEDENRTPIHIKTRVFLLKRLQKLFKLCETSNQVFDFLFKITTSNYEEAKEISFDMFQHFFQKEKDLLGFAAQIDSILCDTIRREMQNPPSVNLTNMKLISKFAKIVSDEVLATKLIQLLSQPLIKESRKKLVPSQFFSEKSQLNILIQRILSLGSMYRKIPSYFDSQIVEQLKCYIEELLEDCFVILCTPRSHVREYQRYNFVYNGKKYSYDSQFIHQSLPKLLRISQLNKPIHFTLIGYVITQQGSFEQSESLFKKTAEFLSKEKITQVNCQRIKGIQLLTEAISRNPNDQLLLQGVQNLLPVIAVEAPYSLSICQAFYQTLVQSQLPIVEPILQIYTLATENNLKLSCLITLLKLITISPHYQDQILTLYWDYLLTQEYDFLRCNQLVQYLHEKINPMKTQGYIQHVLANLSVNEELRLEDYYLLLNINCLINNTQDQIKYQILIDRHFTILINTAINIANQKKSNSQVILATLLPAIYKKIANSEITSYLVIVKFLLLSYLLANDKITIFQNIFRLLSVLSSEEDQNIQVASKQAMKVILMNTQFQSCNLTEQVFAKVYSVYQEIQQEMLYIYNISRKEKQEKEQQLKQQSQQGVIKLKMFG